MEALWKLGSATDERDLVFIYLFTKEKLFTYLSETLCITFNETICFHFNSTKRTDTETVAVEADIPVDMVNVGCYSTVLVSFKLSDYKIKELLAWWRGVAACSRTNTTYVNRWANTQLSHSCEISKSIETRLILTQLRYLFSMI